MNILLCCDWDNGGQMAALWRALNRYTEHKAQLITFRRTYLNYAEDAFNPTPNKVEEMTGWADFYILGEVLVPNIQSGSIYKVISPNNCIVRAAGSLARNYPHIYMDNKLAKIMKTGTYHDHTIASKIFPMAHTVNMYHFDEFPPRSQREPERPFRLVFSGTAKPEGYYDSITAALTMLRERYDNSEVELVQISNTPWGEALKIKATCDLCYDQTSLGFYGSSSVEGMHYNMPTFCYDGVNPSIQTCH